MASASSASNQKSSRFSTLKVFKFSSNHKDLKPPLPPPKDPYYLQNRSLASLSPDSLSLPNSPMSPNSQYSRRPSPDINQSSMSLTSSAASTRSFSPADMTQQIPVQPQRKEKSSGFFKFTKRSPKTSSIKSPPIDDAQPPLQADENISLPWNFQHNIHVDEAYTGMPPSWTTSLAKAGFTEGEIAEIQNKRAETRSLALQYLYTDRPDSPMNMNSNISASPPVLTRPTPRTTSLPRQASDASLRSGTRHEQRSPPPITAPTLGSSPSSISVHSTRSPSNVKASLPGRQFTSPDRSSLHHPSSSSLSLSVSYESHHSDGSQNFGQDARTESLQPSTPARRTYHVANESFALNSPPPSYNNFAPGMNGNGYSADKKDVSTTSRSSPTHPNVTPRPLPKDPFMVGASTSKPPEGPQSEYRLPRSGTDTSVGYSPFVNWGSSSTTNSPDSPQLRASSQIKRLQAFPPRLSLHKADDSTDLSAWGEALLSGITTVSADATPNSSTFAAAQEAKLSSLDKGSPIKNSYSTQPDPPTASSGIATARPSPPERQSEGEREKKQRVPPPTRPIPAVTVHDEKLTQREHISSDPDEDNEVPPSSAWAEPLSTARLSLSSVNGNDNEHDHTAPSPDILSPLWNALAGMVKVDTTRDNRVYTAALNETYSPILPFSPESESREDVIKGRRPSSKDLAGVRKAEDEGFLTAEGRREKGTDRESTRSSTSTVTGLFDPPAIVRSVSIARRAGAYVINKTKTDTTREREVDQEREREDQKQKSNRTALSASALAVGPATLRSSSPANITHEARHPPSPLSSNFGSEEESAFGSGSSSSQSHGHQTPTTEVGTDSPLMYYLDSSPSPDPSKLSFVSGAPQQLLVSAKDTFGEAQAGGVFDDEEDEEAAENSNPTGLATRPTIVINGGSPSSTHPLTLITPGSAPLSPFQRYRGWLSAVVAPLEEFIDEAFDPRDLYLDLQEIAEGESGSVFAARLATTNIHKLKLPPLIKAKDSDDLANGRTTLVAIKSVAISPSGSPKLVDLERELTLLKGLWHENILTMDALYVDLVEDSLWIRMELMERSLADIIGLVGDGLMLQDRMIARFASDVLQALEYLQKQRIAHRDVRSDNLLLNSHGILKLTDFSNAVQVGKESPMCSDLAGVIYWQAPEVRSPPYNALNVDVWSLGATVWEMAEAEPPFAGTQQIGDRWPPLSQPDVYSPGFHGFLRLCSESPASRPTPSELRKSAFILNACGRPVIVQLLSQCMAIEKSLQEGRNAQGPTSE